jgi:hypothetical protein
MPTITVTIDAQQTKYGKAKQISGPDLQRMVDAFRKELGPINEGTPEVPQYRARTDAEVLHGWSDYVFGSLKQIVQHQERQTAMQTASDNVAEVPLT